MTDVKKKKKFLLLHNNTRVCHKDEFISKDRQVGPTWTANTLLLLLLLQLPAERLEPGSDLME